MFCNSCVCVCVKFTAKLAISFCHTKLLPVNMARLCKSLTTKVCILTVDFTSMILHVYMLANPLVEGCSIRPCFHWIMRTTIVIVVRNVTCWCTVIENTWWRFDCVAGWIRRRLTTSSVITIVVLFIWWKLGFIGSPEFLRLLEGIYKFTPMRACVRAFRFYNQIQILSHRCGVDLWYFSE